MDSLLAIVQMPAGIPVATVAIGKPALPMQESSRHKSLARRTHRSQEACRPQGETRARSGREINKLKATLKN